MLLIKTNKFELQTVKQGIYFNMSCLNKTPKRFLQRAASSATKIASSSEKPTGFFGQIRNIMFHDPRKYFKQGFATYNNVTRDADPIKGKGPEMEIDPETGYRIMNPVDYSGKNHILLNQSDLKSEKYYVIRGSFTTSPSPYLGKKPIFFAPQTFDGQNKIQYIHIYDAPILLPKSAVKGLDASTFFLPSSAEIDAFIERHSKAGLYMPPWK